MRLHLLTSSQPYRLRIETRAQSDGLWYSVEYSTFQIGDETTDKYRLEVDGCTGDAGNPLEGSGAFRHDGMMFSTYDQDNDLGDSKCGSTKKGGWWFNACYRCCLMCRGGYHKSFNLPGNYVVDSRMMIKCQHC